MLTDLHPTIRKYPRTQGEAFKYDTAIEGPFKPEPVNKLRVDAEYWVQITLAFAAGFLVHMLWGAK